ncbi:Lrp/AsnC family transcriptional regulator [Isoptericola sp. b490]|uniref:Lrp/AsnC family transcriptional regulator n=1 Tax=Actinotalea lenta TaxID=3064654 RepID=UPI00271363E2|nr:Lrp/AsnC family transcriptional regulator [Isoptericola sp. b490]MDO8120797.1 Lrp/AsnC family transcriptional regulator [Isoptericola sp. b490]
MAITSSSPALTRPLPSKKVRRPALDATDRAILRVLRADARIANNALADLVGVAPSTCLARVRALREAGVIRGFHADIDPAALGQQLQVMIAVRVQGTARAAMSQLGHELAARPEVLDVYFVAGSDDFLVRVAARDTETLRTFVVDQLSARPEISHTETSLIFEHLPGARPATLAPGRRQGDQEQR